MNINAYCKFIHRVLKYNFFQLFFMIICEHPLYFPYSEDFRYLCG